MAPPSPRPRPAVPAQGPAIPVQATVQLPAQTIRPAAPPMPRRVPASVRGTEFPPAAAEPVIPAEPHTTAWPDDAAAFNSGVDAARAHFSN